MDDLQQMICKNCGDTLDLNLAVNGVIRCPSCRSTFTIAKKETSPAAISFLRQGEHDLDTCKFDDARAAYLKAAEYDRNESEAYWGMALAEFKVQYIKDTRENRLQPICHEFTDKVFVKSKHYLNALKCATEDQKKEYAKKAQEIDYIRSEFLKIKQSGLNYDCFICVKVSRLDSEQVDHTKKNWTEDAYDADSIYDLLKRNGHSPFFSEREIRGRTGSDYEAMILYALYTAETMLVVCRNEEYLQTPWVKNEFTRFKELVNNKEKENDALTIVYSGTPIERLPGNNNGKIQGIDYSRREADFEIVKFVESHTPEARKRREEEKRRKQEEADALKRQIEAQLEESKRAQQELEKRLNNINTATPAAGGATATVNSLLTRARQEMSFREFSKARDYFNKVLDADPQNADGWWGLFLLEFDVTDEKELYARLSNDLVERVYNSRNYKSAVKYAAEDTEKRIKEFTSGIQDPEKWWDLFLDDFNTSDSGYIIDNISQEVKDLVKENVNYQNAVKYADEKFKPVLENFDSGLNSPESYWKLFLQEFTVNHENELLELLSEEKRKSIEDSVNYREALRCAEGELKNRIEKFRSAMYSSEIWWKRLLQEFRASSGADLISRATNQQLFDMPDNPYYKNAYNYAKGDFSTIINAFIGELFSFKLWWDRFLRGYGYKTESDMLDNYKYEYRNIPKNNQCYRRAKKYATEEENQRIAAFEQNLKQHEDDYNKAEEYWKELYSEFGCTSDEALKNSEKTFKTVDESVNFLEAVKFAKKSQDKELISRYVTVAKAQRVVAEKNCANRKTKRLDRARKAFLTIAILLCLATALTAILSFLRVKPFETFWVRPVMSFIGSAVWRAVLIAVPLFFAIIFMFIGGKKGFRNGSNIFCIILSSILIVAIAFSALAGLVIKNTTDSNESNLIEYTDQYIISLSTNKEDDTYTVKSVYLIDKEKDSISIPGSWNGKDITAIGKGAFRKSSLEYIKLSDNITEIGEEAFQKCENLKGVNIPASVERIGARAFEGISSPTISFAVTSGWFYTSNSDFTGGSLVESSYLSSGSAAGYLKGLSAYLYREGDYISTENYGISLSLDSVNDTYTVKNVVLYSNSPYSNWTNLSIPDFYDGKKITVIGEGALKNSQFYSINLGNNIVRIGDSAFEGSSNLESINIPSGVMFIGMNAFKGINSNATITFEVTSDWFYTGNSDFTGGNPVVRQYLSPVDAANYLRGSSAYFYRNPDADISDTDTTDTDITVVAMDYWQISLKLDNVSDTYTIKSVNVTAPEFINSYIATIPDTYDGKAITAIGEGAFRNTQFEYLIIGNNIVSIGDYAFAGCEWLANMYIPSSVKSIGKGAFDGLSQYATITFEQSEGWFYAESLDSASGSYMIEPEYLFADNAAYSLRELIGYYLFRL